MRKTKFKQNEDFVFNKGKIELKRKFDGFGAEPGSITYGVGTSKTELGLDKKSQGRVKENVFMLGAGMLVIPFAVYGSGVSKIERDDALCF